MYVYYTDILSFLQRSAPKLRLPILGWEVPGNLRRGDWGGREDWASAGYKATESFVQRSHFHWGTDLFSLGINCNSRFPGAPYPKLPSAFLFLLFKHVCGERTPLPVTGMWPQSKKVKERILKLAQECLLLRYFWYKNGWERSLLSPSAETNVLWVLECGSRCWGQWASVASPEESSRSTSAYCQAPAAEGSFKASLSISLFSGAQMRRARPIGHQLEGVSLYLLPLISGQRGPHFPNKKACLWSLSAKFSSIAPPPSCRITRVPHSAINLSSMLNRMAA